MKRKHLPKLLTPGRMAALLDISPARVNYILSSRHHIQPVALAGNVRLYDRDALAGVRHEVNAIDARRNKREMASV